VDQVLDGDHHQTVLVGEVAQVLAPLHAPVVVDDLGDHPCRRQPGQLGQVDGGLGVPRPHQDPALAVPEWEHVTGLDDLERLGGRVVEHAHGV
jgi:hypothetical protein